MRRYLLLFLMPVFAIVTSAATIYKWVDEKGVTNISETPPPGKKAEKIDAPAPPPKKVTKEAQAQPLTTVESLTKEAAAGNAASLRG